MMLLRLLPIPAVATLISLAAAFSAPAADSAPPLTASDLAARLSTLRQDGSSLVRLRMETKGDKPETLQLQIKQRQTKAGGEYLYQVLWPKERKGEAVLIRKVGNRSATGSVFVPPNTVRPIDDLKEPLFGSDLAYGDVAEDFFSWDQQTLAGSAAVDGVNCQILESKPGKGEHATCSSVKSWIDIQRMVPLRVEKYSSSGQLIRRIDTTRVVADAGHHIPANLTVRDARPGSSTDFDGSRIRHGMNFTDADFSVEGMKQVAVPKGSAE